MTRLAYLTAIALSLAAPALASCSYGTHLHPREEGVPISQFSYTGLTGPLNWFGLNKTANEACAKGHNQSPIDLDHSIHTIEGKSLCFNVESFPYGAELENLGTTVEVPANGTLKADNKTYSLAQFHFHTPSEHRINSEYFPMEAHFVFSAPDKSTAVVAFLISLGHPNILLSSVFEAIEEIATPGEITSTGPLLFDALESHFKSHDVFTYSGSLTTPPCTEGVTWYISSLPLQIDELTYDRVKEVVKFNSRYTQNKLGEVNLLENIANELK
ncbi:carbonate dehydratase [Trichoderma arundinaceum]|uniref:Carbonic anhydrase n=1 Tax=Trichoderma arundinaceum TaxID=490622 RepID=A0A395P168_TRIAR|nr:carbonate dehydratase [Trichoderma arundinaceum]